MATTYVRSLATNFGGNLNPHQFHDEVEADPGIVPALIDISVTGDVVNITFVSALSGAEVIILDGLIAAHVEEVEITSDTQNIGTGGTSTTVVTSQTADRTINMPDADTTLVGNDTVDTLSNKTLTLPKFNDTSADHQYILGVSELAANRTITLPLLGASDIFAFEAATQTLTNKTINTVSNTISIDTADVTTGTFNDLRIAASNITQHQTSITETGALNGGSITSGFGSINNGASAITTTGIITGGNVAVDQIDLNNGTITLTGTSGNNRVVLLDNLADALRITDGTQDYIQIVSSTGADEVKILQNLDVTGNIAVSGTVDGVDIAAHDSSTTEHGATGAVVGTTNTQTLTNKTISDASNTVGANELRTTGASVVIDGAAPPTTGQIIQATSATVASWQTIPLGDVFGAASSTDNAIVRFDGTGGKTLQDSSVLISDTDSITGLVNLTMTGNVSGPDYVDFDIGVGNPAHTEGRMFYDNSEHALAIYNDEADVTHQVGQEGYIRVYNNSGATITNGKAVYISGTEGVENRPTIALARSDSKSTSELIGIATHDIENNTFGYITYWGIINDLDTSSYSAGDILYLDETTAGSFRTTPPSEGNYEAQAGYVIRSHATAGRVIVVINSNLATASGDATDLVVSAIKGTAGTINPGNVVRITGYDTVGNFIEVELADASSSATMPALGISRSAITDAVSGIVVIAGKANGQNTIAYSVGDALYISETAGAVTNVKPTGTALVQKIGIVSRSHVSAGIIEIFGAGRSNDLPNLTNNNIWIGNGSGVPEELAAPTGDFVGTTDAQTLTNKTLTSAILGAPQINDTSEDNKYIFGVSELSANRTITLPSLLANDIFLFEAATQTLTNKTINTASNNTISIDTADVTTGTFADARIAASNITQHQGSITGTGALNSGSITSGFGSIDNGADAITTTGTITGGQVTVDQIDLNAGLITLTGITGNNQIVVPDNLADALTITDGTQNYIQIVSSTGADEVKILQNLDITGDLTASRYNGSFKNETITTSYTVLKTDENTIQFTASAANNTVILPDATTLPNGWNIMISNDETASTIHLVVQRDDLTTYTTVGVGKIINIMLADNGTAAGSWEGITNHNHNIIFVGTDGGEFNSVKSAVDSITDNSSSNRYTIHIGPGEFTEGTIALKPFVSLIGQGTQETVIIASVSTQTMITGSRNSSMRHICLTGASGVGGIGIKMTDAASAAINSTFNAAKVQIKNCETCASCVGAIDFSNRCTLNITTALFTAPFITGMTIEGNVGVAIGAFAIGGMTGDATMVNALNVEGAGGSFLGSSVQIAGLGFGNGVLLRTGASIDISTSKIQGVFTAINVENSGSASNINANNVTTASNTADILVDQTTATGSITGIYERSKTTVNSNTVVIQTQDPTVTGTTINGSLFIGDTVTVSEDATDLIFNGTMGLLNGGALSQGTGDLEVDVTAGLGYMMKTAYDAANNGHHIIRCEWPAQSITIPSGVVRYIYFSNLNVLSLSASTVSSSTGITLGRVSTTGNTSLFEITPVTTVADIGGNLGGKYFTLNAPGTYYYVWFDVDNGSADPAVALKTGIEVDIATGDSANTVASKLQVVLDAETDFSVPAPGASTITITNAVSGNVTDATAGDSGFTIGAITQGDGKVEFIEQSRVDAHHHGNKSAKFIKEILANQYLSGSTVTGNASREIAITAGVYYYCETRYATSGATSPATFYQYNHFIGAWEFASRTVVENTQYDDGTDLTALTASYYVKHLLYIVGSGALERYMLVIGQEEHATLLAAQDGGLPNPPPQFSDGVTKLASLIMQQGNTAIVEIRDERPRLASAASAAITVTDHGGLTGLGDDDHSQYLLVDGTRSMTGGLNMGAQAITNVGNVDGVDISAHASRHAPNGGADALSTAAPLVNIGSGTANGVGTANTFARSDHQHGVDSTIITTTGTQIMSNKTLTLPQFNDTSADNQYILGVSELGANRTITLPLLLANDTFVFEAFTQTLTNKTLTAPTMTDATIGLNDTDSAFQLDLMSTSTLTADKSLTFDVNDVNRIINLGGDLTFANNFTTSGNFALTLTQTGATNVTLPTTGTLISEGSTNTLTNKTINTASNTLTLDAADVTTGTFNDLRIAASNVTQHQGSITGTGALNSGSITSGFGSIDNGADAITTTGTITGGQVTVDQIDLNAGLITLTGTTGNNQIIVPDNLADALTITDGTQNYIQIVSTTGADEVKILQNLNTSGYIQLADNAAPANPSAGEGRLYKKTGDDGIFWKPDAAGPEIDLTGTTFDAIVAASGGNYTLPSTAFAAGATSVFMKSGTYVETANVVIPDGGKLIGEEQGATIQFSGAFGLTLDAGATVETAGTITFTNGSAAVVGTGTTFTNLSNGDYIALGADFYEISVITDAVNIVLVTAWRGRTRTGFPMYGRAMFNNVVVENVTVTSSTSTDAGIFCRGIRDSVMEDVLIESCTHNVKIVDCGATLLHNCTSFNSTNMGFRIDTSRTVRFDHCHVQNNAGDGFHVNTNSLAVKFTGCEADGNGIDGFTVEGASTDVDIVSCGSKNNQGKGCNTEPGTVRCVISGCTIAFNNGDGVDYDGSENTISGSVISNNQGVGVQCGNDGVITGNQIESNAGNGIAAGNDSRQVITGNHISTNGGDGVNLNGTNADNVISGNEITNNTGTGLLIGASGSNNVVGANRVTGNTTAQITDNSATTIFITESKSALTDNALIKGDTSTQGTSGIQASGITIDDTDNMSGIGNITLTGTVDGVDVSAHDASTTEHGATGAVVGTTNTQTLTNKTLTAPIISTISNTGTLTLPTSTDTLVGLATTDILTNKTISDATNTVGANELRTTGASVVIDGAAPPTTGQILKATSATTANWQEDTGGGGGGSNAWKDPCRCATTQDLGSEGTGYAYSSTGGASARGQITWTAGPTTIDGVTLANDDRVLVKDNSAGAENGIWVRTGADTWDRATDFDTDAEVVASIAVYIEEGTASANQMFTLTTINPITIGGASGTVLSFQSFQSSGSDELATVVVSNTTNFTGTGGDVPKTWDTTDEENDPLRVEHDNTTTSRINFKQAGMAQVNATLQIDFSAASDTIIVRIYKNGVLVPNSSSTHTQPTVHSVHTIAYTRCVSVATNDYLELVISMTITTGVVHQNSFASFTLLTAPIGATGAQGSTGANGADGDITWQSAWATATAYTTNQAVENNGSSYVCILNHTSSAGDEPGVGGSWETYWDLMAAKGDVGPAITLTEATATATTTATTTGYTLINGMTLTPASGDYLASFSSSGFGDDGDQIVGFAIFSGGTIVDHSERLIHGAIGNTVADIKLCIHTQAKVTVNGAQAIEAQFKRTVGNFSVTQRSLNIIKI